MSCILQLQVVLPKSLKENENVQNNLVEEEVALVHNIPLDVKLAYKNTNDLDDDWKLMAKRKFEKLFTCFKVYSFQFNFI